MICCLNGKFLKVEEAKVAVLDHGFLYSDGFYDTMKAFDGRILDIESHLERVNKSLKIVKIKLPWSMPTIQKWIEKVAQINSMKLARVRMTITRGVNDFDFNSSKKPTLVIMAEPIEIDPKIYKGVPVITENLQRTLPEIKHIGVTAMIVARSLLIERKAFEALLVDDSGFVREGTITNFFWVKNGKLFTPKKNILEGITRKEVMALWKKWEQKVIEKDVKMGELLKSDEVFLTNTKFGVVPVLSINEKKVGKGKTGEITKQVMVDFEAFIRSYFAA